MSIKNPPPPAGTPPPSSETPAKSSHPDDTTSPETAAVKEWYVLVGMSGMSLRTAEVKELYEANKVRIRGPYSWEEMTRYRANGMVKADSIVYKKGELEWVPFARHDVEPAVEEPKAKPVGEQVKEWYILTGMSGKILESGYVKDLYDKGQVKVRGPYCKEEIAKFFKEELINNDTMLCKKGDRDWKPVSKQPIGSVQEAIKSIIFDSGDDRDGEFTCQNDYVTTAVRFLLGYKKAVAVAVSLAIAAVIAWPYYYYSPNKIYDRIKKSVVVIMCDDIEKKQAGLGSGFIIDGSGLIVTNLHVVEKAANVRVKSGDDITYPVEGIVMIDAKNDIAVLKVTKGDKELIGIPTGEPGKLVVGDHVYTIGSPGGLEFSLSEGLVSGKRNEDPITKKTRELVQLTAPISPGNSGGPVLDDKGRVIGISTMGSRSDYQNLNFAVPVNLVGDVGSYKQIIVKYLPGTPKWKSIGRKELADAPYDEQDETRLEEVDASYDEASVVRYRDRVRLWLRLSVGYSESNFRYSTYFNRQIVQEYALAELDCQNKKYRLNMAFGPLGGERAVVSSNFNDDNKWQSMKGNEFAQFEELCR